MAVGVLKSLQETYRTSVPMTMKDPSDGYSKIRRLTFTHTVAGTDLDAGTTVDLVYIPAGCRLWGGQIFVDAGYANSSATAAIGDGTTAAKYLAAGAIADAGAYAFGNTIALGFGEKVTTAFVMKLTTAAAVLIAAGTMLGYVDITVE